MKCFLRLPATLSLLALGFLPAELTAQSPSTVREYRQSFVTYPFSDPDPVPSQTAIYPYHRFDGFTLQPVNREWTVVELENDYIRVLILPEVGGKIWSAVDKSTGKPYIYANSVVKFRDVAMRGPWTSGGIEPNYGIIGHTPNCATPVNYHVRRHDDGSVSCYVGVLDLLTRTRWQMEVHLPKDRASFTTRSIWQNPTGLEQPYYHWMNTGIKTAGNLEFIFPGTKYIGHDGEHSAWPKHEENGKDLQFYEQNDFGMYKSYHVAGKLTDFFGAYWHDDAFGMVRYAPYDEKPGKKIWIWGLSRQGMIWEKILTDTDGQYAEIQSGRLFNQNAQASTFTPFKHHGFTPHATDRWTEHWYPVNRTRGMVVANADAALNLRIEGGWLKWYCAPVAFFTDDLVIRHNGKEILRRRIQASPLKTISDSLPWSGSSEKLSIKLENQHLEWRSDPDHQQLSRPFESPSSFDWKSALGMALHGKELMDQKMFREAEIKLKQALALDSNNMEALIRMAQLELRNADPEKAFLLSRRALAIDAHHGAANYHYALSAAQTGRLADAFDGFALASQSLEFRSAAYVETARLYAQLKRWKDALEYAEKATDYNRFDLTAAQLKVVALRSLGNSAAARTELERMAVTQPLDPFVMWEKAILSSSSSSKPGLQAFQLQGEMPEENIFELAACYLGIGDRTNGYALLSILPNNPQAQAWLAWLDREDTPKRSERIAKLEALSPAMVFPFRPEMLPILRWAVQQTNDWKPVYYLALLLHDKLGFDEARALVVGLAEKPDHAPFYALRAQWMKDDPASVEKDLRKAMAIDPSSWRYPKLLAQHFIAGGDHAQALSVADAYVKTGKPSFIMDMLHAKTLLLNKQYRACDERLSKMNIIPFEGATEGRALYWEAKMMQAIEALGRKRPKDALKLIEAAGQWPEHLGVGKPYDADIDIRLEQFLTADCLGRLGRFGEAEALRSRILDFKPEVQNTVANFQPVNHLVVRWAQKRNHTSFDWDAWMKNQESHYPQHRKAFDWVRAMAAGNNPAETPDNAWARVMVAYLALNSRR
jgi:tetratricopeptide (TPR) repeat protein